MFNKKQKQIHLGFVCLADMYSYEIQRMSNKDENNIFYDI